jgi:hypothetical protein
MLHPTFGALFVFVCHFTLPAPLAPALAWNVVTSLLLLNKTLALRALLQPLLFGEVFQSLSSIFPVFFNLVFVICVLFTRVSWVVIKTACNTVVSLTQRTLEIGLVFMRKRIGASRLGTPLDLILLIDELVESEVHKFDKILVTDACLNVLGT